MVEFIFNSFELFHVFLTITSWIWNDLTRLFISTFKSISMLPHWNRTKKLFFEHFLPDIFFIKCFKDKWKQYLKTLEHWLWVSIDLKSLKCNVNEMDIRLIWKIISEKNNLNSKLLATSPVVAWLGPDYKHLLVSPSLV